MPKILTFNDGSIYVERPNTRWGRVNVSTDPFLLPDSATTEVCYIPVADAPISTDNKGSTIKISLAMFDYIDKACGHTKQASQWMRTPYMLWINRPYVGDPFGSTLAEGADAVPTAECITGSCNVLRVIGETASHYEIEAWNVGEDIRKYNPALFNFTNFPWLFWKALARKRDGTVQKVGNGLDVYHLNIRKPQNRHYIHKSKLTLFTIPPFTVTYNGARYDVIDYQFIGVNIYGITNNGRVPLLLRGVYQTEWREKGTPVPE